jgi:hypothetical protein
MPLLSLALLIELVTGFDVALGLVSLFGRHPPNQCIHRTTGPAEFSDQAERALDRSVITPITTKKHAVASASE